MAYDQQLSDARAEALRLRNYNTGLAKNVADMEAEIERLRDAIRDIAEMQDDEWSEAKYHAM